MLRKLAGIAAVVAFGLSAAAAQERDFSENEARALEIYRTIIGMRTAKGHGETARMAAYLAEQLRSAGFSENDIEIVSVGEETGLIARYPGKSETNLKPILFLAHMDVVDARAEEWEHDPFTLREADGYFYGRGTADNKYGIMNLTQTFMRLKREGFTPTRDLYLVFTGDEETGMTTTKHFAYERPDLAEAEFALNSDAGGGAIAEDGMPLPYYMQAAEKTYASFFITARNPGGHSSRPRPDNAIYDLSRALLKIEGHRFPVMANDVTRAAARAEGQKRADEIGKALVAFADDPANKKAIRTIRADPGYATMLGTTCVATMLEAGHAENALPQTAKATVNCRIFPGVEVEAVRTKLTEIVSEGFEISPVDDDYVASPASEPREDVTGALLAALRPRYPDIEVVPAMSAGGTDGMHFRRAGVPTYGVGAGFSVAGESSNAHGLNERVRTDFFFAGLDHWIVIIKTLAGQKAQTSSDVQ